LDLLYPGYPKNHSTLSEKITGQAPADPVENAPFGPGVLQAGPVDGIVFINLDRIISFLFHH
jgi:hypothetical protein